MLRKLSMNPQVHRVPVILKRKQVQARTGLSRSGIYQKMAEGGFPKSISLGPRAVGWLEAHIDHWIEGRVTQSVGTKGQS